jgi:3-isopropylmalate dehydrogenase
VISLGEVFKIAVLPGDGIGREVVPEAVRVLEAIEDQMNGFELETHLFHCGGEYYRKHGREWPEEAETFSKDEADAVLLGAVGALDSNGQEIRLPDNNLAGYNIVIGLRMELDLYANVRPVKLLPGVPIPVKKEHESIDMVMVRENTEGLYAPIRGKLSRGKKSNTAIDVRVITRFASERIARYAFEEANSRNGAPKDGINRVTCVDKSNLLSGCQLFRQIFTEVSQAYPNIHTDFAYVDSFVQWLIRKPEYYDVVVAPNEFGDIITDLGAALQGGLGMAPAGNIGEDKAVFEPVHGSAPSHYGKNSANPIAAILSGAMMLEWLGEQNKSESCVLASDTIHKAVQEVLREGKIRTSDLCWGEWADVEPSSTQDMTDEIISQIKEFASER